ncbi:MAG: DUF6612 family protein [Eubacteriales bacterium]
MKKCLPIILVLIITLVLSGCTKSPKDLTADKPADQIVKESFEKWYNLESYEMAMTMNMKMTAEDQTINMSLDGTGVIFQNPMKMKMNIDATIPDMVENIHMEQYMIGENENFTIYQKIMGQWQKMVVDDPALVQMTQLDPSTNLKLFVDNMEKAEIIAEEKIGEKDTLKIELIASSNIFNEVLKDAGSSDLGLNSEIINADFLSKIGDMKYIIWVEKSTLDTLKCSMDLTENMRNLATALAEDENVPAEMKDVFKDMEISMEYTIENQNAAEDFTIPEEALNAQEIEMPTEGVS